MSDWRPSPTQVLLIAGGLAVAAYGMFAASPYDTRVLTIAGVYALLVLGYQFIFGHAGTLSLAQGTFFGLGAYVTGILGTRYGLDFLVTFPLSWLIPAALAAVTASAVLRLESHYLALATLALSQSVLLLAVNWESVTGGANGLAAIPDITVFGQSLSRGTPLLVFVWIWVAVGAVLARRIVAGPYGLALKTMRLSPMAAASIGIDAGALRFTAFVLSASYAGAAGALYAHTLTVISPEVLGFGIMIICLTMTVIGGRWSVAGALCAALLLTHLPEWFRGLREYYLAANGAVLLLAVLFAPAGFLAFLQRRKQTTPTSRSTENPLSPTPRAKNQASLAIRDLGKSFGGLRALSGVNLDLTPGTITGLIGPNGSGKTTLVNLLTGLDTPDQGTVTFGDKPLTGEPSFRVARAGISRTFQTPDLPVGVTVRDSVAAGLEPANPARFWQDLIGPDPSRALAKRRRAAASILHAFGLDEIAGTPCDALPHGQRRLVEVARAAAPEPAFLILDEPTAGLTAEETAAFGHTLRRLAETGCGILLIDHDPDFIAAHADTLLCLHNGEIIARGRPRTVLQDPAVRAAYFGSFDKVAV